MRFCYRFVYASPNSQKLNTVKVKQLVCKMQLILLSTSDICVNFLLKINEIK